MAAAPELLEELEKADRLLGDLGSLYHDETETRKAVIQKARGG
jgi:hypothetical protein